MPQKVERKRQYMREYMRGRRLAKRQRDSLSEAGKSRPPPLVPPEGLTGTNNPQIRTIVKTTVLDKRDVSPRQSYHPYKPPAFYGMNSRRLQVYVAWLNRLGYGVELVGPGCEFVDLATGAVGLAPLYRPLYQQTPTSHVLRDAVLEQRVLALEANLARLEAMMDTVLAEEA